MSATDPLARAGGILLRTRRTRRMTRLPVGIALPVIAVLSLLLWLGLFHLAALVL